LNTCYDGHSSLVDFYTGAGKSLIFQFYSILRPGMTIVLVPLISLMIDQIKKIPEEIPAICYNSWVPFTHRPRVFNLIKNNKVKILFVTPELFVSDIAWRLVMYNTKINLICIDEAHCVSESSHSFRHSYSFLQHYVKVLNATGAIFKGEKYFEVCKEPEPKEDKKTKGKKGKKGKGKKAKKDEPRTLDGAKEEITEEDLDMFAERVKPITDTEDENKVTEGAMEEETPPKKEEPSLVIAEGGSKFPVLCLTATSSASSRKDIIDYFKLAPENVKFSNYYLRDNLHITVSLERSRSKEIDKFLKLKTMRRMKPLLVYCNFKKVTEIVATYLKQSGVNALCFNTNLTDLDRMNVLQAFLKTDVEKAAKPDELGLYTRIDALVTTVSLAMGIDHRSIRSVIHYNMPNSLETYVQEVGRAGRDGKPAHCHLFLNEDDYYFQRSRAFTDYFLDRELIRSVIRMILGLRENLRKLQSGEIEKKIWSYIKKPTINSKFGITQRELLNIFKHLKVYFDENGVEWQYTESLKIRGNMKELKSTKLTQFKTNKLIKLIISKAEKIRKSYSFNIVDMANEIGMNPFMLSIKFKDFSQKVQFSFIPDHPAYLFSRPKAPKDVQLRDVFNVEKMCDWIVKRNNEKILMNAARVDSLYMVLRDHAKKSIAKFLDDDLLADKNHKMEKYVKMYFSYGPIDMI
jgi:superfamily II DNA or RNA helicase